MNRILILIAFLATPQLHADPYETAQRFTAGDVISAEVLNDILDRIELSLKDIERDENNFKRYEFLLKLFDKADIINQINIENNLGK